jgi:hypothetical protein
MTVNYRGICFITLAPGVILLSAVMPCVVMPSVAIPNVLAPQFPPHRGILISAGDPTFSHHFKSWKYFLTEKMKKSIML